MATDFLTDLEPLPDPAGPRRHSISEVEMYLRCPRRWYYKYRVGLPDPSGP